MFFLFYISNGCLALNFTEKCLEHSNYFLLFLRLFSSNVFSLDKKIVLFPGITL